MGGQDCHSDESHPSAGGLDGLFHHLATAKRVHRCHRHAQISRSGDGTGDRIGNIVPLEVEKYLQSPIPQRGEERRAFPRHQNRADLYPLEPGQSIQQMERVRCPGKIQRENNLSHEPAPG